MAVTRSMTQADQETAKQAVHKPVTKTLGKKPAAKKSLQSRLMPTALPRPLGRIVNRNDQTLSRLEHLESIVEDGDKIIRFLKNALEHADDRSTLVRDQRLVHERIDELSCQVRVMAELVAQQSCRCDIGLGISIGETATCGTKRKRDEKVEDEEDVFFIKVEELSHPKRQSIEAEPIPVLPHGARSPVLTSLCAPQFPLKSPVHDFLGSPLPTASATAAHPPSPRSATMNWEPSLLRPMTTSRSPPTTMSVIMYDLGEEVAAPPRKSVSPSISVNMD